MEGKKCLFDFIAFKAIFVFLLVLLLLIIGKQVVLASTVAQPVKYYNVPSASALPNSLTYEVTIPASQSSGSTNGKKDQIVCKRTSTTTARTCTQNGTYIYTGSKSYNVQGSTITYTCKIQVTWMAYGNHILSTPTVKDATCTSDGSKSYKCTRCGRWVKSETIPKLGHNWKSVKTVAPTCTEKGYEVQECSRCGLTRNVNLPYGGSAPLGHHFVNGVCTRSRMWCKRRIRRYFIRYNGTCPHMERCNM